ncbi:acyl carrier protein [Bacillus cereus]|uniref:acyl carrier protein n=1 Tax=Bacillus cereus TaxID=1396 RepID=UPI001D0F1A04|nr:phosphopantetheine-binding protein [Bacillus cereus]MCC2384538.1 phosphopantetheine-binding protein [Bacillus cereus]MCU5756115.1 phosphopantetheine-binding protein [Bacillus cereus]
MQDKNLEQIIHMYIQDYVGIEFNDDTEIFEEGLVNSLFAIQLMTFLEKEFAIKVTMDDLDMDNYKSVNSIGNFIRNKQMVR